MQLAKYSGTSLKWTSSKADTFQFKPLQGGHLSKAYKNFCPVSVRFREVPL